MEIESNNQFYIDKFPNSDKQKKLELLDKIKPLRDEQTLQFLITCLSDEFWLVRRKAAEILKGYGDSIVAILSGALNSYNHDVQHWSLQILSDIGPRGFPAILRAMRSTNDEIRYFATIALGNSKVPQGVSLLLKALGDERWRVRRAASDALVKYGEAVITPLQQVLTETEDEDVRFWTIKTLGKLGPKAQKYLIEALKNGDRQRRYVIAAALGESGDKRIIKILIESLGDPDWTIRKSATMALAEIGDNAINMMLDYLGGPNEEIRDGCLRALVKAGNDSLQKLFDEIVRMDENKRFLIRNSIIKIGNRVVEPLMRLFKNSAPDVQVFAAAALGEIGNPRAVPVLVSGLSNENWNVRRSCSYALTEIGERGVDIIADALSSPNDDVRYWVTRILESIGEAGVPHLVKALKDRNREIRFFAAKALGTSFDPNVARSLVNALADEIWGVRRAAAESLCNLDNLPIEEILRYIPSDNEDIRYWIIHVVKKVGLKYKNRIIDAMHKGDSELRLYACQAAGMINHECFIEPLTRSLSDDSEWVRVYAAISLGQIGDPKSIIPLIRCFSDRNTEVHRSVLEAFNRLGNIVITELIKCTESDDSELKSNAVKILAEMNIQQGLDSIILLTDDPNELVRINSVEAISAYPCAKTRSILKNALDDKNSKVRVAAIKSIARLGTVEDMGLLMEYYASNRGELEQRTIRRVLTEAARDNPDIFIMLFNSTSNNVKNMSLNTLVSAGVEILPHLQKVMNETQNVNITNWLNKTIKQIQVPKENLFYA